MTAPVSVDPKSLSTTGIARSPQSRGNAGAVGAFQPMRAWLRRPGSLAAVLLAPLFLSGCWVASLEPFCHRGESVAAPEVLGRWQTQDEVPEVWVFEATAQGTLFRQEGRPEEPALAACFFRIGSTLLVDLSPTEDDLDRLSGNLRPYVAPTHHPLRLRLTDNHLAFDSLDSQKLAHALQAGTVRASHILRPDDEILLSGSTTELRGLLAWALEAGLFREAGAEDALVRVTASAPPKP